jgi:hypothetical protein
MLQPNLQRLAMVGVTGLALAGASSGPLAVTADDVVCTGCVDTTDIADGTISNLDIKNYSVSSGDINPNITLGKASKGGSIAIRTPVSASALVINADGRTAGTGVVRIGTGGSAGDQTDTDLVVVDPSFTASATEPVLQMDASTGLLTLGSGNAVSNGLGGNLYLESGTGVTTTYLDSSGNHFLGGPGYPGYLALDNGKGSFSSISLSGSSGDVTNQFAGNGLVKAWARINFTGTVASCYRCNTDTVETRRLGGGLYEVDFTPVGTDITGRPWTCSLGTGAVGDANGSIACTARFGDPSSIYVTTINTIGQLGDKDYTVVVY